MTTPFTPVNLSNAGTLDGTGALTLSLGPPDPHVWKDTAIAILVVPPSSVTNPKTPTCNYFVGPRADPVYLIDTTPIGNRNSSRAAARYPISGQEKVWVSWAGGEPNSQATLSVFANEWTGA